MKWVDSGAADLRVAVGHQAKRPPNLETRGYTLATRTFRVELGVANGISSRCFNCLGVQPEMRGLEAHPGPRV